MVTYDQRHSPTPTMHDFCSFEMFRPKFARCSKVFRDRTSGARKGKGRIHVRKVGRYNIAKFQFDENSKIDISIV